MTMRPGTTEPSTTRRIAAMVLVLAILLSVATYAAIASTASNSVRAIRSVALLGSIRADPARGLNMLSSTTIRTAVAATPLDQRIVNVAMARAVRQEGDAKTAAWLATLSRLGWRDTTALQNMLYVAALARDFPRILDLIDALLRRQQLTDQIIPTLSMMELEPQMRTMLAARLAAKPSWSAAYLTATGQLTERDRLLARFAMIRLLERHGVTIDRGDLVPNINALDRGNLPAYGFALWQDVNRHVTRPLDDTSFALASRSYQLGGNPVPYQWEMMTGEGYSADASNDGGHTALSIDWDGRGVPVFAQQRTSAAPGRYGLIVKTPPEDAADLSAIAFRLVCDNVATPFRLIGPARYVTVATVPCAYATFQIVGDVQPSATTHRLMIERISMNALSPANS